MSTSTAKSRYEPAAPGVPTAASSSNISLLQSGYSLDYNSYISAIMGYQISDLKHDLTTTHHGKKAVHSSADTRHR